MTTTGPVVAPAGTGTTMLIADQVVGVAAVPLKVTVLEPCVAPKPVPAIVTAVAAGALVGERLVRVGGTITVKAMLLLARPPTVTTTGPVVAPAGTGTTRLVADLVVGVAATSEALAEEAFYEHLASASSLRPSAIRMISR